MANRYTYQFNASFKPKMSQIEGFVAVGSGGTLDTSTARTPTGWVGGFSGAVGLFGAGVAGISRVATGAYNIQLSDDWVRLDSVQVKEVIGATGAFSNIDSVVSYHTVGLGNTTANKNQIVLQFHNNGAPVDVPSGGGFFLDIRLRDSLAGAQ